MNREDRKVLVAAAQKALMRTPEVQIMRDSFIRNAHPDGNDIKIGHHTAHFTGQHRTHDTELKKGRLQSHWLIDAPGGERIPFAGTAKQATKVLAETAALEVIAHAIS